MLRTRDLVGWWLVNWGLLAGGIALSGCSDYRVFRVAVADPSDVETKEHLKQTARNEDIAGLVEEDQGPSDCELQLKIATWDDKVRSRPVCIKHKGRAIAIPERIALQSDAIQGPQKQIRARYDRYCDPAFDTLYNKRAELCVWNRQFYDNYPINITILSVQDPLSKLSAPLSSALSLVRIIRNGRTVFTWTPKTEPAHATELLIRGDTIRQVEFFKSPVDLGLYLLASGADEATAAAASTAAPPINDWVATLGTAALAAAKELTPKELSAAMTCVNDKLAFLQELGASVNPGATAEDRKKHSDRAQEIDTAIANSTAATITWNDALDKASPLEVRVAAEGSPGSGNAPAQKDGIALESGNLVAFFGTDERTALRSFGGDKKPWGNVAENAFDGHAWKDQWLFRVKEGSRKGQMFATSKDALSTTAAVSTVQKQQICEPIANDVKEAHKDYSDAIRKLLGDGATRRVGEVAKKGEALGAKLGLTLSDLRKSIDEAIDKLPKDQKEKVKNNIAWLHSVDQLFAGALGAASALGKSGQDIEQSVKSTIRDPQAQLRAYEAFASTLPTDTSIFSSPIQNPEAGPGETRLNMKFHRLSQHYWLLAWNAVPLPISSRSRVNVELRLENLIPIVDVYGRYFQTGWDLVPLAGWGVGLVGTRETINPPEGDPYGSDFVLGPQANVSVSGFRLGLSYFYRDAGVDGCSDNCKVDRRNVRVLVGADLIRLFTGKDTAAISGSGGTSNAGD